MCVNFILTHVHVIQSLNTITAKGSTCIYMYMYMYMTMYMYSVHVQCMQGTRTAHASFIMCTCTYMYKARVLQSAYRVFHVYSMIEQLHWYTIHFMETCMNSCPLRKVCRTIQWVVWLWEHNSWDTTQSPSSERKRNNYIHVFVYTVCTIHCM